MTKKKEPNKEQNAIIKRAGLNPLCWIVLQDLNCSMIVRHLITGEIKVIDK